MAHNIYNFLRSGFITTNKYLARHIGLEEAILLSEIISKADYYESKNELDEEGFFYCTSEVLQFETTLTYKQQMRPIKHLIELGLIKVKLAGVPAKRYFKVGNEEKNELEDVFICFDKMSKQGFTKCQNKDLQNVKTSCAEKQEQVVPKRENIYKNNYKNKNNSFSSAPEGAGLEGDDKIDLNFFFKTKPDIDSEDVIGPAIEPTPQVASPPPSFEIPDGFRLVIEDEILPNGYTTIFKQGYCVTNAPCPSEKIQQVKEIPTTIQNLTDLAKKWGCNGKSENYANEFYHYWEAKDWQVTEKGAKMRNAETYFKKFVESKTPNDKKEPHKAYQECVNIFYERHRELNNGRDYVGFSAKDGDAINKIIAKLETEIRNKIIRKNREANVVALDAIEVGKDDIELGFKFFVTENKIQWVNDNFSPTNLNSKFNEIINNIKQNRYGNAGTNSEFGKSPNRPKTQGEVANTVAEIMEIKHPGYIESLLNKLQ